MRATITDSDGMTVVLEGDAVEVSTALATWKGETSLLSSEDETQEKWWQDEVYFSQSQDEHMNIVDMDTNHLANAIAKTLRRQGVSLNWVSRQELTGDILTLILHNEEELPAMISELSERIAKE